MITSRPSRIRFQSASVTGLILTGLLILVSPATGSGAIPGGMFQAKSELQARRDSLMRAIEQGNASPETYFSLVDLLLETGEIPRAESLVEQAVRKFPRSPRVFSAQGRLNLARKDYGAAIESFQNAVQLSGQNREYVENLALAHYEKGMLEFRNRSYLESLADARQALRWVPGRPEFLHLLGLSSYLAGQKTDARKALEKAAELDPGKGTYRYDLAVLLLDMNEAREAEKQLLQAIALDPGIPMAYVYLGRVQHNGKRTAEALANFQKARDLQPDLRGIHYHIGYSHKAMGDDLEAIREMILEIEAHPDFVPALTELGDLYLRTGQAGKAVQYLDRAGKSDPKSARIFYLLGKAMAEMNRVDEALASLNNAVRLAPDQPEPHYVMAQVYMRLGKPDLAQEQLGRFRDKRKKTGSPW